MRLALVSMPWAIFNRPSIQLGTLKSYLDQHGKGLEVEAYHPYLSAASSIGLDTYRIIAADSWAGEALYCALLYPEMHKKAEEVFNNSLGRKNASTLPGFDLLCEKLDEHLDNFLQATDLGACELVGFSVCFGQLPASLLAARRIKKMYPEIKIALGGSTCTQSTGKSLLKVFSALDFIICGEGERPLLNLCTALATQTDPAIPGLLTKKSSTDQKSASNERQEIKDINELPVPDYESYFGELKQSGLAFIPHLPLEFSRGCWWNKCTFCNLNLQWCGYRFKKSKRMISEVKSMVDKYKCLDFAFTDNALPPAEAEDFFKAMTNTPADTKFFAEIRTVHKPDHYALFSSGGLKSVQIGIEAFSDSLLKRMHKGTSVMDNLLAMKLCAENGMLLDGNLILEFPGSTVEEVKETLHVLDFVLPFRPLAPAGFFLGQGSPVWKEPRKFGIRTIRHHPYNRKLYPPTVLQELDMLILQGTGDRKHQRKLWQPVRGKISEWHNFHRNRTNQDFPLSYRDGGDFIIIRQERPGSPVQNHRLTGTSRKIFLACETPVSTKSLLRTFNSVTEKSLNIFLEDLDRKRLVYREGDKCLNLAVKMS